MSSESDTCSSDTCPQGCGGKCQLTHVSETDVDDTSKTDPKTPAVSHPRAKFELNHTAGGSKYYQVKQNVDDHRRRTTQAAFQMCSNELEKLEEEQNEEDMEIEDRNPSEKRKADDISPPVLSRSQKKKLAKKVKKEAKANASKHLSSSSSSLPSSFQAGKIIKDEDDGIHIDTIIDIYKPHVLFLSEVESDLVKLHCPENYTHVPGKQLNSTKLRMSCLILNNIQFTTLDITCETPMVSVVIDGWTCIGLYREWRKCGHKDTDSIEQQTSRLNDLLKTLKKVKGNKVFVGDFNINLLFADTCHYRRLEPLKQMLQDFMLDIGMMQLVKSSTRDTGGSSILYHVYISNPKFLDYVVNNNIIFTDHSCIGLKIRTNKPFFEQEIFMTRHIDSF